MYPESASEDEQELPQFRNKLDLFGLYFSISDDIDPQSHRRSFRCLACDRFFDAKQSKNERLEQHIGEKCLKIDLAKRKKFVDSLHLLNKTGSKKRLASATIGNEEMLIPTHLQPPSKILDMMRKDCCGSSGVSSLSSPSLLESENNSIIGPYSTPQSSGSAGFVNGGGSYAKHSMMSFVDRPLSENEQRAIDKALVCWVACCAIPFNALEHPWFKLLMQRLRPTYSPPSRKVIGGSLLSAEYKLLRELVSKEIERCECVTLSVDGWSDINNKSIYEFNVIFQDGSELPYQTNDYSGNSHTGE